MYGYSVLNKKIVVKAITVYEQYPNFIANFFKSIKTVKLIVMPWY